MKPLENYEELPKTRREADLLNVSYYFTGRSCKRGHVVPRYVKNSDCVSCIVFRYQSQDHETKKKKQKEDYEANKEARNAYKRQWRAQNKDKVRAGREHMKTTRNAQRRARYKQDVKYRLDNQYRNMMRRSIAAARSGKTSSTSELMGYSSSDLKESVESKFLDGMSWENYGDWHIDHMYPISRYVQDGIEDPSIINDLDNLIPMWSEHNIRKDTRTLSEFVRDEKDMEPVYGHFLKEGSV